MTTDEILQLANLLAQLAPLGVQVATQIQAANSGQLKTIADTLTAADGNFDAIAAEAQGELAKLATAAPAAPAKTSAPDPAPPEVTVAAAPVVIAGPGLHTVVPD